ncbi:trigger factor [Thermosynechococcaceae cyanobacterium BACA0444]|uniref:Trigger factor n=1 Tax=Pseudocalidococcus azoricus BACA0444 TaxID=2918990 RepID=A0AAE4JWQ6_9CYAN|nr:trigger factor [Pseudocalidococcus azoricus]MDS3860413.1 trigger factor [Pseudocalidococcus azoricus BACA0444]
MTSTQTPLKVTQEKLPASQVGLEIEIPGATCQEVYDKVVAKVLRSTAVPGFRKGKVPRHILLQRVGIANLKIAALEELVDTSIKAAIRQEEIPALGNLQLRSQFEDLIATFEPGQPLVISASVDVNPDVTLSSYTGLVVEYEPAQPDPDYVSKTLAHHQNERATLLPVEDRPAQAGDVAVVDFRAVFADTQEPIENAQAEDFQLELSQGQFLPELIEGIVGMEVGQTKEINLTFPADYFDQDLVNQAAVFSVTLHELKEKELPPLDDDFAQEISEFKTLAELEAFLNSRQAENVEKTTRTNQEAALLNQLVENLTVELPEVMVQQEVNYILSRTLSRLKSQGLDVGNNIPEEILDSLRQQARPEAIAQLKRTLALGYVAKQEKISPDPEAIQQRIAELNASMQDRRLDQNRLKEVVESEILEELTVNWLLEKSELKIAAPQPASEATPEETSAATATVEVSATPVESQSGNEADSESSPAPKEGSRKRKKPNPSPAADS